MSVFSTLKIITCYTMTSCFPASIYIGLLYAAAEVAAAVMATTMKLSFKIYIICTDVECVCVCVFVWENMLPLVYIPTGAERMTRKIHTYCVPTN